MRLDYAISLWNYSHYTNIHTLEHEIAQIAQQGYGVELWGQWRDVPDLYAPEARARLQPLLQPMQVSLHTAFGYTFAQHQKQIDAAAAWGARTVVVHTDDLCYDQSRSLDPILSRDVVTYASDHGVQIALENGQLPTLVEAIEQVDGLKICLDVGHVYLTPEPMHRFLDLLQDYIVHLHLQDILSPAEAGIPGLGPDHYTLGTGGIPTEDWELLVETLHRIEFEGMAVFEIRPRLPLQTALLSARFMDQLLSRHR